jgi:hypothetical protein
MAPLCVNYQLICGQLPEPKLSALKYTTRIRAFFFANTAPIYFIYYNGVFNTEDFV